MPHTRTTIMPATLHNRGACGKARTPAPHDEAAATRWRTIRRWGPCFAACLAIPLFGCVPTPTGPNGRWIGPLTPVAGTCDPASQAVLLVSSKEATFAPDQGVLLLRGHADASGHVTATLRTTGFNHEPYLLAFTGELQGDRIVGSYVTPRCRATATLTRR